MGQVMLSIIREGATLQVKQVTGSVSLSSTGHFRQKIPCRTEPAHLWVGIHELVLDLIHRVRPVRHGAQMQPLKYHLVPGEGS